MAIRISGGNQRVGIFESESLINLGGGVYRTVRKVFRIRGTSFDCLIPDFQDSGRSVRISEGRMGIVDPGIKEPQKYALPGEI